MKNKFESFTPLMHKLEYELIQRYLSEDDTMLEWGSGNSTIYWSGLVKKVICIEHDSEWIKNVTRIADAYEIKNIDIIHVAAHTPNVVTCRYNQFKDYVNYPVENGLKPTRVLIDGRARKYCAKFLTQIIDKNVIVFIHDFNRLDYQKVLKYYDIIEQVTEGEGIAALRKKKKCVIDENDTEY